MRSVHRGQSLKLVLISGVRHCTVNLQGVQSSSSFFLVMYECYFLIPGVYLFSAVILLSRCNLGCPKTPRATLLVCLGRGHTRSPIFIPAGFQEFSCPSLVHLDRLIKEAVERAWS